ncbi:hypothetical protein JXD38_11920 [candidate division WOR-3 bacterium]|nr:hypothetical protein [candidate division WOR-3 bacterium]
MRPIALTAEARDVLAFICRTQFPLSVYGRSAARVWPMVREQVDWRISRFCVPVHEVNIYRRYVAEMLKAFRTETGEPLARALEICVRKWTNLGLEPELLEQLLLDCHKKFHATGHQMPKTEPLAPAKKPGPKLRRKRKRTYAEALAKGRTSRRPAATTEEQSARHAEGIAQNRDISQKLAVLLKDRRVPGQEFIRYNAFAQKLGQLTRKHGGETLQLAASDLIDLYEAKALDADILRAIAQTLFGI